MYDWANSAFVTVIITTLWPLYFASISGLPEQDATARHAWFTAIALGISAILGPLLGVIADRAPIKKKMLAGFMVFGALATVGLAFVGQGQWMLGGILFGLGNVGVTSSFVFYDGLLPYVAKPEELDRVSTSGYALGYVGGGILLILLLGLILFEPFGLDKGTATRLSFVVVAVWWILFSIPLFRRVPEPMVEPPKEPARASLVTTAFSDVFRTFRELKKYRQAMLFLLAFLIYNDGVGTIIRMATIYGKEKNLSETVMIAAIVVVQFVGIPCTFLFGSIASRIGTRKAIYGGLVIYCLISVLGYFMTSVTHFIGLAALVGLAQGGVQALSRSLFATLIPRRKTTEFFGLFAVFEKFAGIFGPLLFAVIIEATGSSQNAVLGVIAFFAVGAVLLTLVDIEGGQAAARAENDADAAP